MKNRRYCSIKCRQQLRQKLNTRSGLLQALNTRYATFYFSDTLIILDVVPHGVKEIFRYTLLRSADNSPSEDFSKMTDMLGNAWWEEEQRTTKKYLASRHVLELAARCVISPGLLRPRLIYWKLIMLILTPIILVKSSKTLTAARRKFIIPISVVMRKPSENFMPPIWTFCDGRMIPLSFAVVVFLINGTMTQIIKNGSSRYPTANKV
jgi:hypothetical protein